MWTKELRRRGCSDEWRCTLQAIRTRLRPAGGLQRGSIRSGRRLRMPNACSAARGVSSRHVGLWACSAPFHSVDEHIAVDDMGALPASWEALIAEGGAVGRRARRVRVFYAVRSTKGECRISRAPRKMKAAECGFAHLGSASSPIRRGRGRPRVRLVQDCRPALDRGDLLLHLALVLAAASAHPGRLTLVSPTNGLPGAHRVGEARALDVQDMLALLQASESRRDGGRYACRLCSESILRDTEWTAFRTDSSPVVGVSPGD